VARIVSGEFVILMDNLDHPTGADSVAQSVLTVMRTPVELLGHSLVLTVSKGIASRPV